MKRLKTVIQAFVDYHNSLVNSMSNMLNSLDNACKDIQPVDDFGLFVTLCKPGGVQRDPMPFTNATEKSQADPFPFAVCWVFY